MIIKIKNIVFILLANAMVIIAFYSCSSAYKIRELQVYDNTKSIVPANEVVAEFGKPSGKTPIFSFVFKKEGLHSGLPYPSEMTVINQEAGKMGAKKIVLDCPSPGTFGSGICYVYGY